MSDTPRTPRDGGLAFPSVGEGFDNPKYSAPGITLRQWYAGMALTQLVDVSNPKDAAIRCFRQADAMIAAEKADETQ